MLDLLQVAAMLALPMMLIGGLLWLLIYTSVRLALRHEVTRIEHRKVRATRARARAEATSSTRPRLVRPQHASVRASGHARTRTGSTAPAAEPQPASAARVRRAAS
jgi:hypothetical protein